MLPISGDISKRDGLVKYSRVDFLLKSFVIRKNGLRISLITHDRRILPDVIYRRL